MTKLNSELKNEALATLKGKWMAAAVVVLVYVLAIWAGSFIPKVGHLITLLIAFPLSYGLTLLFYDLFKTKKDLEIGRLFEGFQDYGRIFGTGFLAYIYITLWTILLVIPGIIKSYSYALVYYILIDEPELKYNGAIEKSMKMMNGHKMRLFLLDLSFIGWAILSLITLGIGYLFLVPYVQTAHAAFYEELKKDFKEEAGQEQA